MAPGPADRLTGGRDIIDFGKRLSGASELENINCSIEESIRRFEPVNWPSGALIPTSVPQRIEMRYLLTLSFISL